MIAVGITGSYASGKTFVLNYLAGLGFATFSADQYIKELYQKPKIQNKILKLLPNLGSFDKKKIAELIYSNDSSRILLQSFIHPFVVDRLSLFKQQNNSADFTFAEIPLLFESGFDKHFDFYVTTFCSEESRLSRAMYREEFNLTIYKKIIQIQLPQQIKIEKANFVINTDVNIVELDKQVIQLMRTLQCNN